MKSINCCLLDWFATDLTHDVALSAKVLVAQTQEVVDDESLVAIPEGVKVDIVAVFVEEQQGEPGCESIYGYNE